MKITSKGRYAVLAMVDIAKFGVDTPCNLSHVSVRQNISLSYLEQIFNDLKKQSLSKARKVLVVAISLIKSLLRLEYLIFLMLSMSK